MELVPGVVIYARPGDEMLEVHVEVDGRKKTHRVKLAELWAITFALCDSERQEKLMPVRKTEMMVYERIHKVRVKRDLKKGDELKFRCHVDVPLTVVESLGGLVQEKSKPGLILT